LRNRQPDTVPQKPTKRRLESPEVETGFQDSPFRLQYVSNRFQDAFPTISSARTIRSLPRLRDGLHQIHHRSTLA
jgi:hypothetical protein